MTAKAKPCPVCEHMEKPLVDKALGIGQSPRSIRRRYSDLSRRAIQRHRDRCLNENERSAA